MVDENGGDQPSTSPTSAGNDKHAGVHGLDRAAVLPAACGGDGRRTRRSSVMPRMPLSCRVANRLNSASPASSRSAPAPAPQRRSVRRSRRRRTRVSDRIRVPPDGFHRARDDWFLRAARERRAANVHRRAALTIEDRLNKEGYSSPSTRSLWTARDDATRDQDSIPEPRQSARGGRTVRASAGVSRRCRHRRPRSGGREASARLGSVYATAGVRTGASVKSYSNWSTPGSSGFGSGCTMSSGLTALATSLSR